jgi:hypothetical protein
MDMAMQGDAGWKVNGPKAFSSESLPGLDPGWRPVRVKKTRQIKK